jgi:hypothetical protein
MLQEGQRAAQDLFYKVAALGQQRQLTRIHMCIVLSAAGAVH